MQLFLQVVVVIACYIIKQQYIQAQPNRNSESDIDEFDLSKSIEHVAEKIAVSHEMHNHTFVALIDIVFTDGTKRTCTGTIIHDNVVITARHCFGKTHDKFVQPEITASFIVIGSKKMFESGYEQYLPIERIISHPKYRGWTADIALVYTFAGMMSDKPGTIIPLTEDKVSIPNHFNLTVFSWGKCKNSDVQHERENKLNDWKRYTKYSLQANPFFDSEEVMLSKTKKMKNSNIPRLYTKASQKQNVQKTKKSNETKKYEERYKKHSIKANKVKEGIFRSPKLLQEYSDEENLNRDNEREIDHKLVHEPEKTYGSIFKNWRRNMGSEKNELSVENFKFVNMQTCEDMMRKSLPDKYKIKNPNEYVCYSSEDHFVTDEDAGAPALRHGHLVAVTVGGMECDDEHIAVGIKITCYCNWIADNLPDGGTHLNCCDHCCNDKLSDDDDKEDTVLRMSKKKRVRS